MHDPPPELLPNQVTEDTHRELKTDAHLATFQTQNAQGSSPQDMQGLESPGLESGINSFKEATQTFNKIDQYVSGAE